MPSDPTGNVLADFAVAAAGIVNGAAGSDGYTYDDAATGVVLPDGTAQRAPFVDLTDPAPYSFTDCNGWVNFALNSVAPLHQAVLAAARLSPYYRPDVPLVGPSETGGTDTRTINEAEQPMPRAYVMQDVFRAAAGLDQAGDSDGFRRVADLSQLRAGDVLAYSLGRYTDLYDDKLVWPNDTGHVMIVTGATQLVMSSLPAAEQDTLRQAGAERVVAVSVVDSSSVLHMSDATGLGQDDRVDAAKHYRFSDADAARARQLGVPVTAATATTSGSPSPGGLGTGELYFVETAAGGWNQYQFNQNDPVEPLPEAVQIAAARLDPTIDLGKAAVGGQPLELTLMPHRTDTLGDGRYDTAERLSGHGSLLVDGTGTLTLSSNSDFDGGIRLHGVGLALDAAGAAGTGAVSTDAGTSNTIAIDAGTAMLRLAGNDTVSAADGGSTVFGGAALHFAGTGAATVQGGTGSATISGGGAGGLYLGGSAGHNLLLGGGGGATLWGGGNGDQVFGGEGDVLGAAATGNATLVGGTGGTLVDANGTAAFAGAGNTVFGTADGSDTVVGGAGSVTVVAQHGHTILFGGGGDTTAWTGTGLLDDFAGSGTGRLVAGAGSATLRIGHDAGAQQVLALGGGGGSITVQGFRPGTDRFETGNGVSVSSRGVSDGTLVLETSDHTRLTFSGVSSLG
ncbi:MAG: hypothetical protein INR65_02355 [Gluconacetobacter diazotrophicus]|nr:hypothetical protein [Gluconacetobacter diazotrophicus]